MINKGLLLCLARYIAQRYIFAVNHATRFVKHIANFCLLLM